MQAITYQMHGANFRENKMNIEFTQRQKEILNGLLIGTGYIRSYHRSFYTFSYEKDFIYKLASEFEGICDPITLKNNKYYFEINKKNLPNHYYDDWYVSGTKQIPKDIEISKLTIAIWTFLSGYLKKHSEKRLWLQFYTKSFNEQSIQILNTNLNILFGFVPKITNKTEKSFKLKFTTEYTKLFLLKLEDYIEEFKSHKIYDTWKSFEFKRTIEDKFTEQQKNIIEGLMLGDGSMCFSGKNAGLSVGRSTEDIKYLKYHAEIFSKFLTDLGIYDYSYLETRDNRNEIYHKSSFNLSANEELLNFYNRWYPNGTKIVPKDLKLNSEIIATWFADDGNIEKSDGGYFRIRLATHGFKKEDTEWLAEQLSQRYSNKKVRVEKVSNKDDQYTITLNDYVARDMIKDMIPFFPEGMERKMIWIGENLDKKIYSSYLQIKEDRAEQINNFINKLKNDEIFILPDVKKFIMNNYNVSKNELSTKNLKRHINKFVTSGVLQSLGGNKTGLKYKKL
jgi:hypothetical protein